MDGLRYRLSEAQSEIFNSNARFRVAACGRRFGKALCLKTPILTTRGWSVMGELSIGDEVFAPDGTPTRIRKVSEVYEDHEVYELVFTHGERIIADAEHEWFVRYQGKSQLVTTYELSWLDERHLLIEGHHFHENRHSLIGTGINRHFRLLSIKRHKSVPVRCIEVEHPTSMYLCGKGFIPTHNSYLSVFELLQAASIPNSQCWYVTSSYRAAKQIIWEVLKQILLPTGFVAKVNESELLLRLNNGSRIQLKGADNSDALRGVGLDFLVVDEAAYVDEKVWKEVLRPTLSDTGGSALFISSPSGRDWFYKLWLLGRDPEFPEWASWQYTTIDGGNVPEAEIEAARRDLDERTFQQEYEARFTDYFGIIYYGYDPDQSTSNFAIDLSKPFWCGIDMNIDPMSCVVAQRQINRHQPADSELHIVDEIVLYSSNTDELASEIKNRYPVSLCTLFPDPACTQRKTSAGGKTDLSILQSHGFRVRMRHHHPPVRDRINAVNTLLKSSNGDRRLKVNRKCRHLRESLSRQVYKEGTSIPDKSRGFDHLCLGPETLVVTEHGLLPIHLIPEKGRVKDIRNKWVDYHSCQKTRERADVLRLVFKGPDVVEVICTPDHYFLTVHGFFMAEELRDGERMCRLLPQYTPPIRSKKRKVCDDLDSLLETPEFGLEVMEGLTSYRLVEKDFLSSKSEVYCLHVPHLNHFQIGSERAPLITQNCDALGYLVEYNFPVQHGKAVKKRRVGGF